MKRIIPLLALMLLLPASLLAQGWPANYGGVMLQGFSWDSYNDSQWTRLEKQADDFGGIFDLVWVPQSGRCLETTQVMGYTPYYYFDQNSSFGTEAALRSMIATFRNHGIGTIADVVVNHHNTDGWWSFPAETYKGTTYQLRTTDIVSNDDGGATATQAAKDGVELSANADDGTDWSGMRDLDHNSANVQTVVKAYEDFLLNDLGYAGFRYDMVKGFAASHVADYNRAAGVQFSVGECWDSNSTIETWIRNADYQSAAFDFQFKYNVRDAQRANNWALLNSQNNLMHDPAYRRYAVTFVENHDTQVRPDGSSNDPVRRDTLAVNAYLLAMPGTPCVFLPHYLAFKTDIKNMVLARKAAGVTNQTDYQFLASGNTYAEIQSGDNLIAVIGTPNVTVAPDAAAWQRVLAGKGYAYYLAKSLNTVWASVPSGIYQEPQQVTLSAVTGLSGARIVYTTDGSEPTAQSPQVADGATVTIGQTATLKAALLVGSTVMGTITRHYTIDESVFTPYIIKVYVNADKAGWSTASGINFWSWGGDGSHAPANTSWPGDRVTATETVDGRTWFVKEFTINSESDFVSLVFSTGSGSPQTLDVANVSQTKFFEVTAATQQGKNVVSEVAVATSVGTPEVAVRRAAPGPRYNLAGQRVGSTWRGIVVQDGRKFLSK